MNFLKKVLLSCFVLVFVVSCNSSDKKNLVINKGVLTVGMDLSYPPFETIDKKGNPEGISVQMVKDLAKFLNLKLDIKNTAWTGLISGLTLGSFDIVVSSLSITKERQEIIDFSDPYANLSLGLLFYKNSKFHQLKDLETGTPHIVAKKGTIGPVIAKELFPNAIIHQFENVSAMILEVSEGKADVAIYDPLTLFKNHQNYPATTVLDIHPLKGSVMPMGVGFKKGNSLLKAKVNEFIKSYHQQGGFKKLADVYLKDIQAEFKKQHVKFFLS